MSETVNNVQRSNEVNKMNGEESFGSYVQNWFRRIRSGDLGSLPIIIGLIVIAATFGSIEPIFFSGRNFVNLLLQMAGYAALAIGVVFVLLIAEIDLSNIQEKGMQTILQRSTKRGLISVNPSERYKVALYDNGKFIKSSEITLVAQMQGISVLLYERGNNKINNGNNFYCYFDKKDTIVCGCFFNAKEQNM